MSGIRPTVGLLVVFLASALAIGGCSAISDAVSDSTPDSVSEAGDRASQARASRSDDDDSSDDNGSASSEIASATGVSDVVEESDPNDPVAIGPGGEQSDINRRYRNRPQRCRSGRNWNDEVVGEEDDQGSSGITGSTVEDPNKVMVSMFNTSMAESPTPRQYLIRVMCGTDVYGMDTWVEERPVTTNYSSNEDQYMRLARYLDEGGDPDNDDLNTLYQAIVGHFCWANAQWNLDKAYLPYLNCRRIAGEIPTVGEVGEAFDRLYPGHAFERQNMTYITELAHNVKGELYSAYDAIEDDVSGLKSLREAMYDAMTEREEKRERLAHIYQQVDPITELVVDSVDNRPPADCKETLLDARAELAEELFGGRPAAGDELRTLVAGHALGYQITEALAYCHLAQDRTTQGREAHNMLEQGSRRATEAEVAFLAAYGALSKVQADEGHDDVLDGYVPVAINDVYHMVRPPTMGVHRSLYYEVPAQDRFRTVGDSPEEPAVVASIEDVDEGLRVVFEEFSETIHYRERECIETNRIIRYDQRGDSIYPVYERNCYAIGETKTRTVTHQAEPVVLPEDEAARIEVGKQIRVRYNRLHDADAAVLHMFEPGEDRESGTIIDGVDVAR